MRLARPWAGMIIDFQQGSRARLTSRPVHIMTTTPEAQAARIEALTAALHQYRSDMLYPPATDSRERRIAMIEKLLTEGMDA